MLSLIPGTGLDAVLPQSLCSRTLMSRLILKSVAVFVELKQCLLFAVTAGCLRWNIHNIYSTINPVVKHFLDPT